MSQTTHPTEHLAAYALGILDSDEADLTASHLAQCESCRAEWRALQAVVDDLPLAARAADPPAGLRAAVLQSVTATRTPAQSPASQIPTPTSPPWWERLALGWRRTAPVWGLASLMLIVVLSLSNLSLRQELLQERVAVPANLQTLRLHGTEAAPQAAALMVFNPEGTEGSLVANDLPPLAEGQAFQFWLIDHDGNRTSGGLLFVSSSGYGYLRLLSEEPLQSFSGFGITMEPAGGSPQPTGTRILGSAF